MRIAAMTCGLLLIASTSFAATTLTYDGTPLPIRMSLGHPIEIHIPAAIKDIVTIIPEAMVQIVPSDKDPKRMHILALSAKIKGDIRVNTVGGKSYVFALSAYVGEIDTVIMIVDKPQPGSGEDTPQPSVKHAKSLPVPDSFRPVLFTLLGSDYGLKLVTTHHNLLTTPDQRVDQLMAVHGRGYYGFTQRVTNTSATQKRLWLPELSDPYARLYAASIHDRGHQPPLRAGQPLHLLYPGQSLLLHLVYEVVR